MELSLIPTVLILLYFALVVAIGIWSAGKITDDISYYLADRGLGAAFAGVGRFATVSSAFTFVGALGLGYQFGFPFLMSIAVGLIVGFLMVQLLLSEIRRSDAVSIADFFAQRYTSAVVRVVASMIAVLVMFPHLVAQLKGAGVIGEAVIGFPASWSMVVVAIVFTAYVVMGGLWAISWTDAFQGLLLAIFMVVPAVMAIAQFGPDLATAASEANARFLEGVPALSVWSHVGVAVTFIGSLMVFPAFVFWSFSTTSIGTLRRSITVAIVLGLVVYTTYFFVLGAAFVLAPDLDNPDAAYFATLANLGASNRVLLGLAAAAAMSAIMSSTDGMLIATASIVSRDIWPILRPRTDPSRLLVIGRTASVLIAAGALLFALNTPAIVGELTAAAAGSGASAFVFPLVLGIWWRRANTAGALAGMLGGYAAFMLLTFGASMPPQTPVLLSVPVSALLCVAVSLLTAPPPPMQTAFVERLHTATAPAAPAPPGR